MSEFGHFGAIGGGVCIDAWGAGPFLIKAGTRTYRFEDSDRFGPVLVRADGMEPKEPYPPERSRFWVAHRQWVSQGRRLEEDSVTCIWDEPKPTTCRKVGRRNVVVENGEEGGPFICLDDTIPTGQEPDHG